MKDAKLKIYPAVIAILVLSLVALLLSRFEIQVETETGTPPGVSSDVPKSDPPTRPNPPAVDPTPVRSPIATQPSPNSTLSVPTPSEPQTNSSQSSGSLRVSNQTEHPVRVALLYQPPNGSQTNPTQQDYGQPVHWDFAPQEGKSKGLILSLPNANLQLRAGDILVAFAQDGSRRYWGPYIVGKTDMPIWNPETKEWVFVLQP